MKVAILLLVILVILCFCKDSATTYVKEGFDPYGKAGPYKAILNDCHNNCRLQDPTTTFNVGDDLVCFNECDNMVTKMIQEGAPPVPLSKLDDSSICYNKCANSQIECRDILKCTIDCYDYRQAAKMCNRLCHHAPKKGKMAMNCNMCHAICMGKQKSFGLGSKSRFKI